MLAGSQGADGSNPLSVARIIAGLGVAGDGGVNGYTYEWLRRRFL